MNVGQVVFGQEGVGGHVGDGVVLQEHLLQAREDGKDLQGRNLVAASVQNLQCLNVQFFNLQCFPVATKHFLHSTF